MPMDRSKYPDDWEEISARIRFERANGQCEQCGLVHGSFIQRGIGEDKGTYLVCHMPDRWPGKGIPEQIHDDYNVFCEDTGKPLGMRRLSEYEGKPPILVILTVGHLNHDTSDNRDENLKAWCQRCHLAYDADLHKANAAKTRRAKKAIGDLFEVAQ